MRSLVLVLAIANLGQAPAVKGGTVTGTVQVKRGGRVVELWVYLESTTKVRKPGKDVVARIEQIGLTFKPSSLMIPTGATVFFPNRDNEEHNVFSPAKKKGGWLGFNLNRYKTDEVGKHQKFGREGEFDIYCDVHPDMVAAVKVVPSRHYGRVVNGTYTFTDVPPGVYRVVAWSPGSEESSSEEALVEADRTKQVESFPFMPKVRDTAHARYDGSPYPAYVPKKP